MELRWVREIVSLAHLTPVPSAPSVIAGAMNFRGAIVSVLGGAALLSASMPAPPEKLRQPRPGDSVILIDVDGTRAALAADRIDEVTTLVASRDSPDLLVDTRGRTVPLIDPVAVLANARALVGEAAGRRDGSGT